MTSQTPLHAAEMRVELPDALAPWTWVAAPAATSSASASVSNRLGDVHIVICRGRCSTSPTASEMAGTTFAPCSPMPPPTPRGRPVDAVTFVLLTMIPDQPLYRQGVGDPRPGGVTGCRFFRRPQVVAKAARHALHAILLAAVVLLGQRLPVTRPRPHSKPGLKRCGFRKWGKCPTCGLCALLYLCLPWFDSLPPPPARAPAAPPSALPRASASR
jgi:hypothetical protein